MTISAKIIADTLSPRGKRITTLQLRYPRYIHAEFMTHRVFSRNASSSRAIPIERLIQDIIDDPVEPIFLENKRGMSAETYISGWKLETSKLYWNKARQNAITSAKDLSQLGVHKQIVNRLLEPFAHINVLVTSTEWDNFFSLRISPEAQQEICELAKNIKKAMDESTPKGYTLHTPYIKDEDVAALKNNVNDVLKVSVARCARVSYLNFNNIRDYDEDIALYEKLYKSRHMSPFEHVAYSSDDPNLQSGNFKGWAQLRGSVENLCEKR